MKRLVVMACIMALALIAEAGCGRSTGQGTRVGTIIKVSDEGLWHKTHEIEIVRGGMNAASGGFGVEPFFATVTDDDTYQEARQFFDSQTEVEISYIEIWYAPWSSQCGGKDEDCAFVTGIRKR